MKMTMLSNYKFKKYKITYHTEYYSLAKLGSKKNSYPKKLSYFMSVLVEAESNLFHMLDDEYTYQKRHNYFIYVIEDLDRIFEFSGIYINGFYTERFIIFFKRLAERVCNIFRKDRITFIHLAPFRKLLFEIVTKTIAYHKSLVNSKKYNSLYKGDVKKDYSNNKETDEKEPNYKDVPWFFTHAVEYDHNAFKIQKESQQFINELVKHLTNKKNSNKEYKINYYSNAEERKTQIAENKQSGK